MVAIRYTALAALAIAAPLHALLFSTGHHRGAVKRLANANPIPAPVEDGSDYYRNLALAKRAGPAKDVHCAAKHRGGKYQHHTGSSAQPASTGNSSNPTQETVAEAEATTTTPVAATTTTTTKAQTTTTSRTTTKTTTTKAAAATTTAASSGSSSDDGLTSSQQATFLSLHNSIRSEHGAVDLTWSDELATAAKGWADNCVFQHSKGAIGPYGENLAAGTGSAYDVSTAMKSWTDEISAYSSSNP
ncbi:hypothetical protein FRB90_009793, partial [Tulasnella sp. 427]